MKSILSLILSNHPRISLSSQLRDRDSSTTNGSRYRIPSIASPTDGGESVNVTIALAAPVFSRHFRYENTITEYRSQQAPGGKQLLITPYVTRSPASQMINGVPTILPRHLLAYTHQKPDLKGKILNSAAKIPCIVPSFIDA